MPSFLAMPIAENSDGTLWIDINEMTEVDEVQAKLVALGVRVAAVIPDPGCDVAVNEVGLGGDDGGSDPPT